MPVRGGDYQGARSMRRRFQGDEVRIAELRRGQGWSQERLLAELEHHARRLDRAVPNRNSLRTKLSRWENGHNVPDEVARELLCAALGCSEVELGVGESSAPVGGLEPPPSPTSSAAITPDTLQIYKTLLQQYAQPVEDGRALMPAGAAPAWSAS